jgi:hypothetical protein
MKSAFFLAVLFILCIGASSGATITFDDLANETAVTGLGNDEVEINAWVEYRINYLGLPSWKEAATIEGGAILAEGRLYMTAEDIFLPYAYISATFSVPVSEVTLDVRRDQVYGIEISVLGESGDGATYTQFFDVPGWDFYEPRWRSQTFTAPDGGRINSIQLHMWDDMHTTIGADNISYITVPDGGGTASLLAISFLALGLARRKKP